VRTFWRDRIVQVSAAVVAVGLLIALVWSTAASDRSDGVADTGTATATPVSQAQPVDLADVDDISEMVGRRVVADDAVVVSVPGDEGFWLATGGKDAWVQLVTAGESPFTVKSGDRVSFTGDVVAHGADFAERPEFSELDAQQLRDAGAHIEVPVGDVRLSQ
jgi:hypothetical protein